GCVTFAGRSIALMTCAPTVTPRGKEHPMAGIRRIVHPTDFSKASAAAFAKAVELAKSNRADLVVLHVLAPSLPLMAGDEYVSPQIYEDLDKAARAHASKELASLVAKAKK